MTIPAGLFDRKQLSQEDLDALRCAPTGVIEITHPMLDAWNRGWRQGVLVGTLVTTALLGVGIAFVIFIDWLGKCA